MTFSAPAAPTVHVASEVFPFSRTGGLADVLGALPAAQAAAGDAVMVVSPWYQDLADAGRVQQLGALAVDGVSEVRLGHERRGGVDYLFLGMEVFERSGLYHPDDVQRFSAFGRAVLPALHHLDIRPRVLHGHDWQAGLAVAHAHLSGLPTVCTVHNLQYQGRWNIHEAAGWTGLPDWAFQPDFAEFHGDLNLLKAGLVFADRVTTVSPTYAQEITTPQYGEGLEGVLQRLTAEGRLRGILNGLDLDRWNPRRDPYVMNYSGLRGKSSNRRRLRQEFGFDRAPVLGTVSRLADQKGMDLLLMALPQLVKNWNVVILGGGDPLLEAAFQGWNLHPRVAFVSGLNEALAHRIYAGADAFAMPSRFEPCGLSQMIALRYGTLPVVRETGGLKDTVSPSVGFTFGPATSQALLDACGEALAARRDKADWERRVREGMSLNFSWDASAQAYRDLYAEVLAGR
ncbi:Glycogen synthase [Deinococcus proteolyticus MRP]|uniref:Glycogen synthase n=1 Tax=Deinococcus proteolyticus (strain ATCC 35074 / DSM 20540 / JCM 6276 / NBRC 101906 / NCIMB 13154 / VKM Ac-1939 / CCM 2703 / MRP) TaxID=693977 RepID=F0RMT6_DEIPM|nr:MULTISPECIES: glycogen/starch synthase [Deinococcus]ADY27154.1 Glycogen synthase [Deinococcus proteolyticus MRP]MCY1703278.1 glycogen/starch synthase [Deinococcus sp. SL84]